MLVNAAPSAPVAAVTGPTAPAPIHLPQPLGWWRGLGLLLALCQPVAGLLLSLLYWKASDPKAARFAHWCLVLAILGCLLGLGLGALKSGVDGGEWFIQPY